MEKALILIVEDQLLVAQSIEAMVKGHGMEVLGTVTSGEAALTFAEQRPPDLVIMDIKLQGKLDGIQTAKALHETLRIPVIFLSDFTDNVTVKKALAAYPVNYLAKPFTERDLLRAVDLAIFNANAIRAQHNNEDDEFVFLKTGPQTYSRLDYQNIVFLEAERAYCSVHGTDKTHVVAASMATLLEQLDPQRFVKIHRSFVVNIRKVREFTGTEIVVDGHRLPVSEQHRAELMNRLNILH